jgi:photosystem II stability/assembly factor-like uncharacterized protein
MTETCKRIFVCLLPAAALLFSLPAWSIDLLELPAVQSGAATRTLLLDITTRDEESFVAVGTFGVVVVSDDDGKSWQQASVPASVTLTAVDFPSPDKGWAVGHDGLILHSDDGGRTWRKQLDGHQLNEQIVAVAERIVENSRLELEKLSTEENADPYDVEDAEFMLEEAEFMLEGAMDDTEAGPVRPLLDVWFRNQREGVVLGSYGMLLLTDDGGDTWRLESDRMDNPEAFHLNQIRPAPDGTVFIAGESGYVYRSRDGGLTWDSLEPGYEGSYHGLVIVPGEAGGYEVLVFGLQGNVFSSHDQGDSWRQVDAGTSVTLLAGTMLADTSVMLAGSGGVIVKRPAGGEAFTAAGNADRRVVSGMIQCGGGNVVLVGLGGIRKVDVNGLPLDDETCSEGDQP